MVSSVSRHNKNCCNFKTGQCAQYGVGGGGVLPIKKRFWQTPLIIVVVKSDVNNFLKNTVNIVKFIIKKNNMYGKININVVVVILYFVIMYVKNVKSCGPSWQKNKVFSNLI